MGHPAAGRHVDDRCRPRHERRRGHSLALARWHSLGPGIDAYRPQADGFALNEVGTFAGVEVATTGIHTLRIATPTKNPASAGYFGYLTWIRLVRE